MPPQSDLYFLRFTGNPKYGKERPLVGLLLKVSCVFCIEVAHVSCEVKAVGLLLPRASAGGLDDE